MEKFLLIVDYDMQKMIHLIVTNEETFEKQRCKYNSFLNI